MLGHRQSEGSGGFLPCLLAAIDVTAGSREGRSRGETKNQMNRAFFGTLAASPSCCPEGGFVLDVAPIDQILQQLGGQRFKSGQCVGPGRR